MAEEHVVFKSVSVLVHSKTVTEHYLLHTFNVINLHTYMQHSSSEKQVLTI